MPIGRKMPFERPFNDANLADPLRAQPCLWVWQRNVSAHPAITGEVVLQKAQSPMKYKPRVSLT